MNGELVEATYTDAFGDRRRIAAEDRAGVLDAMGLEPNADGVDDAAVVVAPPGAALPAPAELTLEDGSELGAVTELPPDLPYGYHRLSSGERSAMLICGPGRCHLPPELRDWGWMIQLAATRSSRSWGIGDLGDLAELGRVSAAMGAGFIAVSPLGAPNPGPDPEPSPYYPSTRRFGNPLHLRVSAVPGADAVDHLEVEGRSLNDERRIDRARVAALKLRALEAAWLAGRFDLDAFAAWRAERGRALERWAIFSVLSEQLGPGWQGWPEPFRDPAGSAVRRAAAEHRDRVTFHAWLQWCFDRQLADASRPLRRIADMPVGVDPGGFDAWDWQRQLATRASVGAPPDRFNAVGQDWGLPPFIPHRLRQARYGPFIDTIRAQLRHAGGLRIDHVLGLFRLWWIPQGRPPTRGAYVRYPADELLEIVALESHRAGAVVIGEDLGTVPPGVRPALRRRRVLSTRLVLFERRAPERYPRGAFAAVTTHDLPTTAGTWTSWDLVDQARARQRPDERALSQLRARLARAAGLSPDAAVEEVTEAVHRRLAAAPPMLVGATLEDALGVPERPNIPGTVSSQRDNWSLALPVPLDELEQHAGVRSLAEALRRGPAPSGAGGSAPLVRRREDEAAQRGE